MNRISVIIPVYNAEETLRKCVESIVYGEERSVEVILVEDCSKDNSWELCVELEQEFSQVKCYKNDKNRGVSYSRNLGLKKASGKYILFVDSDDWVSGRYIKRMKEMVIKYPDFFVLCGYHYYDNTRDLKKKYLWDGYEQEIIFNRESFFELLRGVLLQQLWNKIFCRDIIERKNVHFDESQSMGEDFQFVLDYMHAAQIEDCIMINEPLYYYIRSNNVSLMSKFGFAQQEKVIERYKLLCKIAGEDNFKVREQYLKTLENTKRNLIYQIGHSSACKQEKIELIGKLTGKENALKHYRKQRILVYKEKILYQLDVLSKIQQRVKGKIQRHRRDKVALQAKKQLTSEEFTVISQNCIGGVLYHDLGVKFLSPTINLYFKEPDFVKFVQNLEYYINLELKLRWEEEFPVGIIGDISVYFMHYKTCREAKEAWERRKKRIKWDKILIIATDMAGFDERTWDEWCKIDYPKVLFTIKESNLPGIVSYPEYRGKGHVPNLIPNREFYKNGILMKMLNDL